MSNAIDFERLERQRAINRAKQNLRLEGLSISDDAALLLKNVVSGELSFDKYRDAVLDRSTLQEQTGRPSPSQQDDSYARASGVLHNSFNSDNAQFVEQKTADLAVSRLAQLELGLGPTRTFDRAHLSQLHKHIFQDIYPWAGTVRSETAAVNGVTYEPFDVQSSGSQHRSHDAIDKAIDQQLGELPDRGDYRNDIERFSTETGLIFRDMARLQPFRHGTGLVNRAFIGSIADASGIDLQYRVIARKRLIEADEATDAESNHFDHSDILRDAADPARRAAIVTAYKNLDQNGIDPTAQHVRTRRPGETVEGVFYLRDAAVITLIDERHRLVVVPAPDVPTPPLSGRVRVAERTTYDQVMRDLSERSKTRSPEQLLHLFQTEEKAKVLNIPQLAKAHAAIEEVSRRADKELGYNHPTRANILSAAVKQVEADISAGKAHDRSLSERLVNRAKGKGAERGMNMEH